MASAGSPRIVISGIGVVSPFGIGRERFWDHVTRGCSGTRAITDWDASDFACRVAAPVTGVAVDDIPPLEGDGAGGQTNRAGPKSHSRGAVVGGISAGEAWADAGPRVRATNAGVVTCRGG